MDATAFSPDGMRLATAGCDIDYGHTVRQWHVAAGKELAVLHHGNRVHAIASSPDGICLATDSGAGAARLWDAAAGKELVVLRHGDSVKTVVFSADGMRLATASYDGTARLWDVAKRQALAVLRHEGSVNAVAFSPDGIRLATTSLDGTARQWQVRIEELVGLACRTVNGNLSRDEWRQYLGDREYRPTCPGLPVPEETPVP